MMPPAPVVVVPAVTMVVPVTPIRAIIASIVPGSDVDTERSHTGIESLSIRRHGGHQRKPRETGQQKLFHLCLLVDSFPARFPGCYCRKTRSRLSLFPSIVICFERICER